MNTGPWTCQGCSGLGAAEVPVNPFEPWQTATSWHRVECPDCLGAGSALCDYCGEEVATVKEDGLLLCPRCYRSALQEAAREALEEPSQESNRLFQVRP